MAAPSTPPRLTLVEGPPLAAWSLLVLGAGAAIQLSDTPPSLALVLGAFVGSWFHGEVGRQRSTAVEWLLYGAIGVVWLVASAVLLLR